MSKLLAVIHRLRKDTASDWTEELYKFNIEPDISPLYDSGISVIKKNTLFAYIILAYDNDSEWMEVHKVRSQVKIKILERLGADVKDDFYKEVLAGKNDMVQRVAMWFILYQRDYRWDEVRACFDYHSEMMMSAGVNNPDKIFYDDVEKDEEGVEQLITITEDIDPEKQIQNKIKKAATIRAGMEMREIGEQKLKDIQREYVNIDTALHKEGAPRLTELVDIMKWEPFIKSIRVKQH